MNPSTATRLPATMSHPSVIIRSPTAFRTEKKAKLGRRPK